MASQRKRSPPKTLDARMHIWLTVSTRVLSEPARERQQGSLQKPVATRLGANATRFFERTRATKCRSVSLDFQRAADATPVRSRSTYLRSLQARFLVPERTCWV